VVWIVCGPDPVSHVSFVQSAALPPGTARVFAAYNITGVEDMIKRIAVLAAPPSVASDLDASPSTTASASATPKPLPLTFIEEFAESRT